MIPGPNLDSAFADIVLFNIQLAVEPDEQPALGLSVEVCWAPGKCADNQCYSATGRGSSKILINSRIIGNIFPGIIVLRLFASA